MSDMNTVLAAARKVMDENGLTHWKLGTDTNYALLGHTDMDEKRIVLSKQYIEMLDDEHNRLTYLHEIAHALVADKYGPEESERIGHGMKWKAMAKQVGALPEARSDEPLAVPPEAYEPGSGPHDDKPVLTPEWQFRVDMAYMATMDNEEQVTYYHPRKVVSHA